jgi:hypothetical protein
MKFKYLKALGLVGLVAAAGCVDLTEDVVSGVTSSYYNTEEGLNAAVNAAYSGLQDLYGQERNMTFLEYGVDYWAGGADGSRKWWNTYGPQLEPRDAWNGDQWEVLYRGINTINAVINRAPEVPTSEAKKALAIAEGRFLRGLYYFYLVRQYGDVAVSTEETQGVIVESHRTSKAEVYANVIIPDLQAAIAGLPLTASAGRATKGAAEHLLALVYLTRNDPGDAAQAESLTREVIGSGVYELMPTYADVFKMENEASKEIVFSIQSTADPLTYGQGNRFHLYWRMVYDTEPGLSRSLLYGRPFRRLRPSEYMLDSLFNRSIDDRWDSMFQRVWYANKAAPGLAVGDTAIFQPWVKTKDLDQAKYCGKPYEIFTEPDDFDNPKTKPLGDACPNLKSEYNPTYFPTLTKWDEPGRSTINQEQGQRDFPVYRLSDTYLMLAESLIRQGKQADAVPYVNKVRERAAKPGHAADMDVGVSDMTLDFILAERGRELFSEGHRWFDLVRFGKLVELVKARNTDAAPNIQPYHVLRPIPQEQIDLTHNEDGSSFGQNPGYGSTE